MRMIVRFKGKFKDLIPDGWTFQKLFARNYRQYHKTCDGEQYSQGCRIWQHLGGYLEIEDLFNLSWIVVQQIKDGKIDEWAYRYNSFFVNGEIEIGYWFKIDRIDGIFHPASSQKYWDLGREELNFCKLPKEISKQKAKEFYDRYRSWNMRPELIPMIKDLLDRGLIDIEEDKTPRKWGA